MSLTLPKFYKNLPPHAKLNEIGQSLAAELWPNFQYSGRLPSCILKILIFGHV